LLKQERCNLGNFSELFRLFSPTWKWPNLTSSTSHSQERQFPEVKEDSDTLTAQQMRFPLWLSGRLEEASGRPSVFKEVFKHLSRHQSQRAHVRTNFRTTQQTPRPNTSCSMQCRNSKLKAANSEDIIEKYYGLLILTSVCKVCNKNINAEIKTTHRFLLTKCVSFCVDCILLDKITSM
jgi:hypothetical protein